MLLQRLICYLRGYLIIQADSCFPERFLNICTKRNILLWNIKKLGESRMRANISLHGFLLLRQIAYKTRTHVKIVEKRGLPFLLHKYRKRKLAAIGLVLFAGLMWYFSSHVMGITVTGEERVPEETILECMDNFGAGLGERLKSIDTDLLQNRMMTELDQIAWIGISQKGSRLYVEVKERLETEPELDTDTPCNLVAEHDGVITGLEVKEGQTVVKMNDTVSAGDLLVSGVMDSTAQGMRYVHSFGNIYAATWYKKTGEYPMQYEERVPTGQQKTKVRAQILNLKLNLYFNGRPPYPEYEKTEEKREYALPIDIFPSLYLTYDTYTEQKIVQKSRTEAETVAFGENDLKQQLDAELPEDAEVKNISTTYRTTADGTIQVTVEYECRENIAKQSVIDKIDILPYDREEKNSTENTEHTVQ